MYQEIQEEERMKEVKALEHIKWLNERENKKLELERAWRPVAKTNPNLPAKRKLSELNRVESIALSLKKDSDIEIAKLSAQRFVVDSRDQQFSTNFFKGYFFQQTILKFKK